MVFSYWITSQWGPSCLLWESVVVASFIVFITVILVGYILVNLYFYRDKKEVNVNVNVKWFSSKLQIAGFCSQYTSFEKLILLEILWSCKFFQ